MKDIAVRTWKSDGSRNAMKLDAAVDNLLANGWGEAGFTREAIARMLLDGQCPETKHAKFNVPR